ncbi:MAG: hypothetical protein MZW92_15300 [Comamonadaceae bacterium]|nr:hypothetical protein [Comamonadaceae bacterium]
MPRGCEAAGGTPRPGRDAARILDLRRAAARGATPTSRCCRAYPQALRAAAAHCSGCASLGRCST